jgi:5,5'-dehydrodivanillate O-demethylase
MTLTAEENERLTRVGKGTPMGELLRRYWYPVSIARELNAENPTKFVRLLGEDLVLFRDKSGRAGLLADHCSHRGASLLYGRAEERGLACAYHGWLYDTEGRCLETPAEPGDSSFYLTIRHLAYPVQEFVGLIWAYLGPLPSPVIPRYDVWSRSDGVLRLAVYPRLDANWLQVMENTADPTHAQILHQEFIAGGRPVPSTTRGFVDRIAGLDYAEEPFGLVKLRRFANGHVERHPLIFPNILRESNVAQIRVPVDDTHTDFFFVHFIPLNDEADPDAIETDEVLYLDPFKGPAEGIHPFTRFRLSCVLAQDHMAWETQGPIADRTVERLATSDRCVVMFREMLAREIDNVQRGLDPIAVIRDPQHEVIDTYVGESIAAKGWYTPRQYAQMDAHRGAAVRGEVRYA